MAGGKETPRQKMIGMMYLVLTALLALNVSKEVIAAFVTINEKLDRSSSVIHLKSEDAYAGFDKKKAALLLQEADLEEFNEWNKRADQLKQETKSVISYILSECNEMIKMAEGEDWIESQDNNGLITKLKPLIDIQNMDNYDIPTNLFVGSNPSNPNNRGMAIRSKIHDYRDRVCKMMCTYTKGTKTYKFDPPKKESDLEAALSTVNQEDKDRVRQFYSMLTIPEKLQSHDDGIGLLPWASVTFDHAPIVAAASLLNSLKLDIKNAESMVSDFLLTKVNAPLFDFNKIEPLAFASSGYINQGDSLDLSIMIAAYDSNATTKIRYGIDADTLVEKWKETTGKLALSSQTPGQHIVKGAIGVKERGETVWKPWNFNYTVGKPMGVVALPNMRVLYKDYDNEVEGTASGFPAERVSLSGSGCSIKKQGGKWVAIPDRGTRMAKISVIGTNKDGTKTNLGTYEFKIKNKPRPELYLGNIKNGRNPSRSEVFPQRVASIRYDNSVNLTDITFTIISGVVTVEGKTTKGKILAGGKLDDTALRLLRQSQGSVVTLYAKYRDSKGTQGNAIPLQFTTR